jgi:hypothetical protein
MGITHSQAAKQAASNAVVDLVDAGAAAGYITICQDATVLVTLTCNDPAFGDADVDGTAAIDVDPVLSAVASGTGSINNFKVYDSNDALVFAGTAGTVGTDMIVDNVSINAGQVFTLTSLTYDSAEA